MLNYFMATIAPYTDNRSICENRDNYGIKKFKRQLVVRSPHLWCNLRSVCSAFQLENSGLAMIGSISTVTNKLSLDNHNATLFIFLNI